MGVLYYVIYNPLRKKKPRLEVYQLEKDTYQLLKGEPIWLSEIGLGIGREIGTYQGINREWLYWYDENGKRYLTPEETIVKERQQGEQKGKIEGKQELILALITQKFGQSLKVERQVKQLVSNQLDNLALALFNFSQLEELIQWIQQEIREE